MSIVANLVEGENPISFDDESVLTFLFRPENLLDANCPINIDSKSYEASKRLMDKNRNNRYIFDEAAGHVYQLMKNDSYTRYLRSDMYKEFKENSERRRANQVTFDVFKPQITTLKHKFNF